MDKYSLVDYYRWSLQPSNLVILRTKRGLPLAVMRLIIHGGYISLDMLATNQNYQHHGLGTAMLALIETTLAPFFGKKEVRLEALSGSVAWYMKFGYSQTGSTSADRRWEALTPMRKVLP